MASFATPNSPAIRYIRKAFGGNPEPPQTPISQDELAALVQKQSAPSSTAAATNPIESAAKDRATELANGVFLRRAQDSLHRQLVNPQFYGVNPADVRQQIDQNSARIADISRSGGDRGVPLQGEDKARFMNAGREATNFLNPEEQQPSTPNADLFARAKAVQAAFAAKRQQAALGLGDNTMAEYRSLAAPPANLDPATRNEQVLGEQNAQRLARLKSLEAAGVQLTPEENAQVPTPDQGPTPQDRAEGVAAFTGEMNDINARRTITPEMLRDRAITKRAQELAGLAQSEDANTAVAGMRKNEAEMLAAKHQLAVAKVKGETSRALQAGQPSPEVLAAQNQIAVKKAQAELGGVGSADEFNQGVLALGGPNIGDSKIKSAADTLNSEGGMILRGTLTNFTGLRGVIGEVRGIDNPNQRSAAARAILRGINPDARQRILQRGDDDEAKKILVELSQYAANG